jgi:hypothetical protein
VRPVALRLQAKQDQGGDVGLTFTLEDKDGEATTIALTMAVKSEVGSKFAAGAVYYMYLEPRDTTGDLAPAGEKLAE